MINSTHAPIDFCSEHNHRLVNGICPESAKYATALAEFNKLPHVDNDQLDGSVSHLVFRAQHELDIWHEGEWPDDLPFTASEENKIRRFICKFGTKEDVARMNDETPAIVSSIHRNRK